MSLDRPRRIFRGSKRASRRVVRHQPGLPGVRRALMVGLVGAAGGAALMLVGLSTDLFGRVPPGPSEINADAAQVIVIDGETLRLGTTIIRLSGLAAPARGEACAAGPDCGSRASAALAELVKDDTVICQIADHDPGEHLSGRCKAGGRDLNAALVLTGWARAMSPDLDTMQADARAHRRGLWLAG